MDFRLKYECTKENVFLKEKNIPIMLQLYEWSGFAQTYGVIYAEFLN